MLISREQCDAAASILSQDPAFIMGVRRALLDSGLAELCGLTIAEASLDPFRPCPADWTALQISYFDNGEPEKKRNRPKIQKTRMRFGGNIKVWTRSSINFSNEKHVAWQANFHLWTADQARQIVRDLREEGYVGDETVAAMDSAVALDATNPGLRFSIPLLRQDGGTRWMREHLIVTQMQDEKPFAAILHFPEFADGLATAAFDNRATDGSALRGNAILQARLARVAEFNPWATAIVD